MKPCPANLLTQETLNSLSYDVNLTPDAQVLEDYMIEQMDRVGVGLASWDDLCDDGAGESLLLQRWLTYDTCQTFLRQDFQPASTEAALRWAHDPTAENMGSLVGDSDSLAASIVRGWITRIPLGFLNFHSRFFTRENWEVLENETVFRYLVLHWLDQQGLLPELPV